MRSLRPFGAPIRFYDDGNYHPVFAPDRLTLYFTGGGFQLAYATRATLQDSLGAPQPIALFGPGTNLNTFSPRGNDTLYVSAQDFGDFDIWKVERTGPD